MAKVYLIQRRHEVGEVTWRSAIVLGIGDDDTIDAVSEGEHASQRAARAWVEQHLPHSDFPNWVADRRHGVAGAFLFGQVERGYYTGPDTDDWEPDPDAPIWNADLVRGVMHWWEWG